MASVAARVGSPVDRFFEYSLLGLLASGYLAVLGSGSLDAPAAIIAGAALIYRALLAGGIAQWRPSQRAVAAATLAYMAFYPLDYLFLSKSFIPATVHLVFFIAVVKLLTASTRRDFLLLKLIAFLEILAACVLSSGVNFFVFLALFLLLGVATFMSSEIRRGALPSTFARPAGRRLGLRLAGVAGGVSLGILILTGVLFFLLPRTARAALDHLLQHRYRLAGFSNEVTLGETGQIKALDTPVMHIRLDHNLPRVAALHWRGATLAYFDGHRWDNPPRRGQVLRPNGDGRFWLGPWTPNKDISYTVHMNEPAPEGALFFAGSPQSLSINAPFVIRMPGNTYRLLAGSSAGLQYRAFGYLDTPDAESASQNGAPDALPDRAREQYLQLPPIDPRIRDLANTVTALDAGPDAKARGLEDYLRTNFGYTLELPKEEESHPLASFLFERKKGHCEYFASAMAVMLRAVGIPSRVVTGFAGGLFNPVSGWLIIRAADAHSWVEAWLPDRGWTAFDPTPPDPNPPALSAWTHFGFYLDAASQFWQDWVLNYSLDRQILLAVQMEQSGRHLRANGFSGLKAAMARWRAKAASFGSAYTAVLLPLIVLGILFSRFGPGGMAWWRLRRRFQHVREGRAAAPSDATLLYGRMLRALKRRGIEKPAWLTPMEFARVLPDPELSLLVEDLTWAYNELRFGDRPDAAAKMVLLLDRLEAPAH